MSEPVLMAKSADQGGTTLHDHTLHVVQAIDRMVAALPTSFGFDRDCVRIGAVIHDAGKGHPDFQAKLKTGRLPFDPTRKTHRHELSSLLFLPLRPRSEWAALTDLIVGHHRSVEKCSKHQGLLDLIEYDPDETFEVHAAGWADWSPLVMSQVIEPLDVATRSIPLDEARAAWDWAVGHVEARRPGWSPLRGLLMSADHFASAMMAETGTQSVRLYAAPDLGAYNRRSALHPLSLLPADDPRPHTLVLAPTGAGKTDFLLRRCRGRVFYTLPFQASINAMAERIERDLRLAGNPTDVRRVHAASQLRLDGSEMVEDRRLQRHPGASVKVLTPHQLASVVFGTSGYEMTALDLAGCDVILDEVHVYAEIAQAMVLEIVRTLIGLNCRVHIGTATLPTALAVPLLELLGGEANVATVSLTDDVLVTFDRHTVEKHDSEDDWLDVLPDALADGEHVLVVCNRVRTAQERYIELAKRFPDVKIMLLHSRFRRRDRAALESLIETFEQMDGPCLVVSTQVVEVSLDISFDRMLTDAAPLDSLIQRFGRINRRRTADTIGRLRCVHVLAPPESARDVLPYKLDTVRASFDALPDGPLPELALQALIDTVYPSVDLLEMDAHTIRLYDERPQIDQLCHRPKAVLLDALEIESATCVIESDAAAYRAGGWAGRTALEIPLPWQTIARHARTLTVIETGHRPFLVPDAWYDPTLGLTLPTTDSDDRRFL